MFLALCAPAFTQGSVALSSVVLADPPYDIAVGDVNGDTFPDIVAISRTSASVRIITGNGAGTYTLQGSPPQTPGGATGNEAVALADLDGSNGLDIVVVNRDNGTVNLFTNNGSGTFVASSIDLDTVNGGALSPANPTAVAAVGGAPGEIWITTYGHPVLPSSGRLIRVTAPLGAATTTSALSGGTFSDVCTGDFNRDGNLDVAASNNSTGTPGGIHVLTGNGAGVFTPQAPIVPGSGIGKGVVALESAAIDGAGLADDLVVAFLPTTLPFSPIGGTATLINDGVLTTVGFASGTLRTSIGGRHAVAGDFAGNAATDVMEVQALGAVRSHVDFAGAGPFFAAQANLPSTLGGFTGPDVVRLRSGELDSSPLFPACADHRELVAASQTQSRVYIARFTSWYAPSVFASAGVGDAGVNLTLPGGNPILPNANFSVTVNGGVSRAFASAILLVQDQTSGFVAPIAVGGGLSIIIDGGTAFSFLFTATDAGGQGGFTFPLPNDPALGCIKLAVQWGILDGLGLLSGISISNGGRLTFGFL